MSKFINDKIHGYMEFEEICLKIIDTEEFQRLRNLKQLGVCNFVFPCANNSRFEHSLGVAYLSEKMIKNIKLNQPELNITDNDVLLVKIAALIHDLGHSCFSHFFDSMFLKDIKSPYKEHEFRSIWLFENMVKKYNLNLSESDVEIIKNLIDPKDKQHYLYHIVSNNLNSLDTDKLDYLQRDTNSLGLSYSINSQRIITQSRVIDNEICYPIKEAYNIYEVFHTRYRLHKEIYTHPVVQQIEYMILDILNSADNVLNIRKDIEDYEKFIKLTDNIIEIIDFSNNPLLETSQNIIKRLKKRDLYKFIYEKKYDVGININTDSLFDKYPNLNKNDLIFHNMSIGYTGNIHNPVDSISFYDLNKNNISFKSEKNNISKLLPNDFQENILRIFSRNSKNIDYSYIEFDVLF